MPQTPTFETRLFSDIEHKLPADTRARWRNTRNADEFDTETVFNHPGELALDALDLDALPTPEPHVLILLVEGSLRVARNHRDEGKDWIDVSHTAPGRLPDALRMFKAASRALQQTNADLLAGSPPNRDDAFAQGHWRARGYLH